MRIGVLGGGAIGVALAKSWAAAGHGITFGAFDGDHRPPIAEARLDEVRATITDADVVLLALPSEAVPEVAQRFGPELAGRAVIDPSIRLDGGSAPMNRFAELSAVGARYIRAFSTQGPEVLDDPIIDGHRPDQFFTADDEASRLIARDLITEVGLRPVYVGGNERVDVVDGVTRLWFSLAISQGLGRHLSFRMFND